ncbi:hypothetical protein [Flavobacterium sp. H122]|uniref:hypothetical protein n=1 Tax=Flavobacterium sp. H122 TaxID=2529860 RepID=UPI0010AACBC0|nr:hypothetical protein [Flavobacterium sp. H122]
MPLPQLGLSMSITDNDGSPLYAGVGQREHMTEFDSALKKHTITIVITDEETGKVNVNFTRNNKTSEVELPTYKMSMTDDLTNETTFYEVTRDTLLLKELKTKSISRFSFLGIEWFKREVLKLASISYEPLKNSIEHFEVSKYRTLRENYLAYTLKKGEAVANLVAGEIPENLFNAAKTDNFFCVIDNSNGQRFIGDIKYREKFLKMTPNVEIQLIKRDKSVKEIEFDTKGKVNKIVYL